MTRVSQSEVLSMRRELLEEIPVKFRTRLVDMDHLLGWPPAESNVEADRYSRMLRAMARRLALYRRRTAAWQAANQDMHDRQSGPIERLRAENRRLRAEVEYFSGGTVRREETT
jgi:hypothetical protein